MTKKEEKKEKENTPTLAHESALGRAHFPFGRKDEKRTSAAPSGHAYLFSSRGNRVSSGECQTHTLHTRAHTASEKLAPADSEGEKENIRVPLTVLFRDVYVCIPASKKKTPVFGHWWESARREPFLPSVLVCGLTYKHSAAPGLAPRWSA